MTARVLVAYAASTGFTSQLAAEVGTEIAEVSGVEVDVRPITYAPSMEPYQAVFLGWSGHSRAGRRETLRFLSRNARWLPDRRIWVVHRQPGGGDGESVRRRGPLRLSRLLVRHGGAPAQTYDLHGRDPMHDTLRDPMHDTLPGLLPLVPRLDSEMLKPELLLPELLLPEVRHPEVRHPEKRAS